MIRRLMLGCAFLLGPALLVSITNDATATTLAELSTDQMTDASDRVVRGTITEVWAEKSDTGEIWTKAQVEVARTLKGAHVDTLIVSQLGGVLMNDYQALPMAPRFSVGEETILFLEDMPSGITSVVGLWQGKYTVRIDPDNGQEMLVRFVLSQDAWYDHRFLPHPSPEARVYVSDFEANVVNRAETGWDGQPIPGASLERLERINATPTKAEVIR